MNLILSTCGTSILTNNGNDNLRKLLNQYANVKNSNDILSTDKNNIVKHIDECKKIFTNSSFEDAKRSSAELNGILSFYNKQPTKENKQDIHYLLATDTWLGEETANIVKLWLEICGFTDIRIHRHKDLQTSKMQYFRDSLSELVKWCAEIIAPQHTKHCRVIFNLSGGFKSQTGFLQMLGMFYADEIVYIFERSNELMRIPHLPVRMEDEESIRNDLSDFRRAALKLIVNSKKCGIYWFEMDGVYSLTEWGELVFRQHKAKIYQEAIHPSPSEKIIFAPSFLNSCEKETPSHKQEINEKIDMLTQFLENANHINPRSLRYHHVTHPRNGRVTHEIYAWSDDSAKRIYCESFDNGTIRLLFLGEHL